MTSIIIIVLISINKHKQQQTANIEQQFIKPTSTYAEKLKILDTYNMLGLIFSNEIEQSRRKSKQCSYYDDINE